MKSKIRQRLGEGQISIGTWLNLASPLAAEVMASVGFDWLAVDAEHAPLGLGGITEIFRAAESRGATPIVRTWDDQVSTLGRVLDAGALGVVVPHVRTAEQAETIARACRYPPKGNRSSGTTRALTWGMDYRSWVNGEVVVIPQIEDQEGIENAESIMAVEGVDIGFLGPGDLALDLEVSPGSPEHEEAIQTFLSACQKLNKPCGLPVPSAKALRQRMDQGFSFFDLSNDLALLRDEAQSQLAEARG